MKNLSNSNGAAILRLLKRLMVFYITCAIAILITVLMTPIGIVYWICREETRNGVWQTWFAWRPIKLENINKYVWLKNIERFASWSEHGVYRNGIVVFRLPEKQPEINNI